MGTKSLRHKFVSAIPDGPTSSVVRSSNWNDEHDFLLGFNAQTGLSYTIADADNLSFISFNNAAGMAVALPQAGSAGGTLFKSGWVIFVKNVGTVGTVTITPTTSTIGGAASLVLPPLYGAIIFSNGTNYNVLLTPRLLTDQSNTWNGTQVVLGSVIVRGSGTALQFEDWASSTHAWQWTSVSNTANLYATSPGIYVLQIDESGLVTLPGGRIKFPTTQIPSADANTLDDYEEGTWTPVLNTFSGGASSVSGEYTKIGNRVSLTYTLVSSGALASTAGTSNITGLPFTPATTTATVTSNNSVANLGPGAIFTIGALYTPTWAANNLTTFGSCQYKV